MCSFDPVLKIARSVCLLGFCSFSFRVGIERGFNLLIFGASTTIGFCLLFRYSALLSVFLFVLTFSYLFLRTETRVLDFQRLGSR